MNALLVRPFAECDAQAQLNPNTVLQISPALQMDPGQQLDAGQIQPQISPGTVTSAQCDPGSWAQVNCDPDAVASGPTSA